MSVTYDPTKLTPEENAVINAILNKNNAMLEPERETKVWKPSYKDEYYFIDSTGAVVSTTWNCLNAENRRYAIGNCFKDEKEAKFAVERLKVLAELRRFAEEHDDPVNWTDRLKMKYSIIYDHYDGWVVANCTSSTQEASIYFSSPEVANAAIKFIGEDRLKKYYLCV